MTTTYIVGVREVHIRHFEVGAETPEAAKRLVNNRAPKAVDMEFVEYSHELGMDTWSVEVKPEKDTN